MPILFSRMFLAARYLRIVRQPVVFLEPTERQRWNPLASPLHATIAYQPSLNFGSFLCHSERSRRAQHDTRREVSGDVLETLQHPHPLTVVFFRRDYAPVA